MADKNTVYMSEKQKVKEITDKLEAGLKELFESEKYKSYLSTMSKFHNYSFNNTLLIAMQKPKSACDRILIFLSGDVYKRQVQFPPLKQKGRRNTICKAWNRTLLDTMSKSQWKNLL